MRDVHKLISILTHQALYVMTVQMASGFGLIQQTIAC